MRAAGLLERAIAYALVGLDEVTPPLLSAPTPCAGWDLRTLIEHLNDSLCVLREGIETRCVAPGLPVASDDPVATFKVRGQALLGALTAEGLAEDPVSIAELPLPATIMAGTGAVEIVVHGWDVAVACGRRRPIPAALATELLGICPLIASGAVRGDLFAPPVPVAPSAGPGDRLVAFLGRDPDSAMSSPASAGLYAHDDDNPEEP